MYDTSRFLRQLRTIPYPALIGCASNRSPNLEEEGCAYEEREQSAPQPPEPPGAVDDTCGRHRIDDTRHRGGMVQYLRGPLGSATRSSGGGCVASGAAS